MVETVPVRNAMPVSTRNPPITRSTCRKVAAEAREERRKRLDRERRQQEWNAQAERNKPKAGRRPFHRLLGRRDREDRGQDRTDAWRPAESEGKPHHIGAPEPDGLSPSPSFSASTANSNQAKEVQAHDDDGDTGDDRKFG